MKKNKGFSSLIIALVIGAIALGVGVVTIVLIVNNSNSDTSNGDNSSLSENNSEEKSSSALPNGRKMIEGVRKTATPTKPSNLSANDEKRWADMERFWQAEKEYEEMIGSTPGSLFVSKMGAAFKGKNGYHALVDYFIANRKNEDDASLKRALLNPEQIIAQDMACADDLFCDPDGNSYYLTPGTPENIEEATEVDHLVYLLDGYLCGESEGTFVNETGDPMLIGDYGDMSMAYVFENGQTYCWDNREWAKKL